MVEKLELPQSNVARLVKDGAQSQIESGVMLTKDTK